MLVKGMPAARYSAYKGGATHRLGESSIWATRLSTLHRKGYCQSNRGSICCSMSMLLLRWLPEDNAALKVQGNRKHMVL